MYAMHMVKQSSWNELVYVYANQQQWERGAVG